MRKIEELLSGLAIQIEALHELYLKGSSYPSEKMKLVENAFSFYQCDAAIDEITERKNLSYLSNLKKRIEQIKNNPDVIESITMFLWLGGTSMWRSMVSTKADLNERLEFYCKKISIIEDAILTKTASTRDAIQLTATAVDKLIELEFNGKSVFPYKTNEQREVIIDGLQKFIANQLDLLNTPIEIKNIEKQLAYYLITKIASNSQIEFNNIRNITINGDPFVEASRATAQSKILIKIQNHTLPSKSLQFIQEINRIIEKYSR